jgi:Voltage gated chloride channel
MHDLERERRISRPRGRVHPGRLGIGFESGEILHLRRNDLRILVGCGAAGGIAAAFNAPLAGAFYAFELVIGGYTVAALAPVVVSALAGTVVAQQLGTHAGPIPIATNAIPIWQDELPLVLLVAVLASLVGIALMMAVTRAERLFARLRVSPALKPAIGGIAVGMLAWSFPQVLSSGHGALESTLYALLSTPLPLRDMAMVLLFKSAASAISIGCGFRGGLLSRPLFPATAQHGWYVLDPPRNETASRRNYCLFNYLGVGTGWNQAAENRASRPMAGQIRRNSPGLPRVPRAWGRARTCPASRRKLVDLESRGVSQRGLFRSSVD